MVKLSTFRSSKSYKTIYFGQTCRCTRPTTSTTISTLAYDARNAIISAAQGCPAPYDQTHQIDSGRILMLSVYLSIFDGRLSATLKTLCS
jgi:hypothetical protein